MKGHLFIEKYFWIFLITGLLLGLVYPLFNAFLMSLLKPLLMVMLFLVFLKTDIALVLKNMKNFKVMSFLVLMNMMVKPLVLFFSIGLFNEKLAMGILLLASMPAAIASPAFTDIVNGNSALSASLVIITSIIAPLSVPLLFWITNSNDLSIHPWWLFKDLTLIIFLPMIASQVIKRFLSRFLTGKYHLFTPVNILILSLMVYAVMGAQRNVMLNDSEKILWQIGFLYFIFIVLHFFGYLIGFTEDKKGKIATTITSAYRNNGMAIVLAAVYFEPSILILMILSELPWNTLLIPFRRIMNQPGF